MSEDKWQKLRSLTSARIGLSKAGGSLTTKAMLAFRKDHALARDAVWAELDVESLSENLKSLGLNVQTLSSQANSRETYIKQPELGRSLSQKSAWELGRVKKEKFDLSISIADGLSALAIERHAVNFLKEFLPLISQFSIAPISIIKQGRVAISDEIGERLKAKLSIILIGERPGLTSPDSLGIYLTYQPKAGNTDEKRNCISNIRNGGLSYEFAANKLAFLVTESMRRKLSGVDLKDTFDHKQIDNGRTEK